MRSLNVKIEMLDRHNSLRIGCSNEKNEKTDRPKPSQVKNSNKKHRKKKQKSIKKKNIYRLLGN